MLLLRLLTKKNELLSTAPGTRRLHSKIIAGIVLGKRMFQCVGIPFGDGYSMIVALGLVDRICSKGEGEPSGCCAFFIPVKSKQSPHDVCSLCFASF